ncbi:hypothetical protein GGQ84_001617 [Desulfitispora alkaliphila]|uniref:hypothetical protein n=1 Tax=Desulfitispora alkaliphila TaxID=622674 RepID=UPI003D1BFFB9
MKSNLLIMAAVALFTAIVLLGGIIVGAMVLNKNDNTNNTPGNSQAVSLDAAPPAAPETISIPGYAQLVMKAGELMQDVELYNPAGNPCYFIISIILPDGTEVYKSGPINAGQKTDVIKLSQPLEAGTYKDAVLKYSTFSSTNDEPMNGANTKFTLEVVE